MNFFLFNNKLFLSIIFCIVMKCNNLDKYYFFHNFAKNYKRPVYLSNCNTLSLVFKHFYISYKYIFGNYEVQIIYVSSVPKSTFSRIINQVYVFYCTITIYCFRLYVFFKFTKLTCIMFQPWTIYNCFIIEIYEV